jgi:hypothetical protein
MSMGSRLVGAWGQSCSLDHARFTGVTVRWGHVLHLTYALLRGARVHIESPSKVHQAAHAETAGHRHIALNQRGRSLFVRVGEGFDRKCEPKSRPGTSSKARVEGVGIDFVIAQVVQRVLEGAGRQLGFKVNREEARAGVDLLAAGHEVPPICRSLFACKWCA